MHFPKGVYVDVRVEKRFTSRLKLTNGKLEDVNERKSGGAFIRMYDGKKWLYSATTDLDSIDDEIERLYREASPSDGIEDDPVVKKMEINKERLIQYEDVSVEKISLEDKRNLIMSYSDLFDVDEIKMWRGYYVDERVVKEIRSSLGTDVVFDFQRAGIAFFFDMADGDKRFSESFDRTQEVFKGLDGYRKDIEERIKESIDFLKKSRAVKPGRYTVVLAPIATGIFAHESFGHKSEADFMLGDETALKEWALGKKVGSEILSIVDDGNIRGTGCVPFDDEGTKAKKTYLIKNGVLTGRLHSVYTAAMLSEEPTGNGRSISFLYEPIVRMTTTYIEPGDLTFEELISDIKEGVFIKTVKHGSGMSVFTIAPSMAYMIRNGRIEEPVQISVVTGNVFKTLSMIEGLSNELELFSFTLGGCGKMEQQRLPVGFGGPYMRVKELEVG